MTLRVIRVKLARLYCPAIFEFIKNISLTLIQSVILSCVSTAEDIPRGYEIVPIHIGKSPDTNGLIIKTCIILMLTNSKFGLNLEAVSSVGVINGKIKLDIVNPEPI